MLQALLKKCSELPISPDRVFLFSNNRVILDFYPVLKLVLTDPDDLARIIHNFDRYVQSIKWIDGEVETMIADDPAELSGQETNFLKLLGIKMRIEEIDVPSALESAKPAEPIQIEVFDCR